MKEFSGDFSKSEQTQHLVEQTTGELFTIEKNLQKLVISEWVGHASQANAEKHKLDIQKKNQLKVATIKSRCATFTTDFSSITKGQWATKAISTFDKITDQINELLD